MLRRSLVVLAAVLFSFTAVACGDSSSSASEFCSLEDDESLNNAEKPEDLEAAFEKMKEKAPDEIKDDVEILADAMSDPAGAAEGDADKVQKAAENVDKYVEENCK